jgi:hypothetical protein
VFESVAALPSTFTIMHFKATRSLPPFVAHSSNVNCLALGRKSAGVLVTGGEDAQINVWRIGRPAALLHLSGHISPITCVDFDHREEMVTGGSFGGSMKIFDLTAHGKVVRTYQGHHTAVTSIDHHPYGGHVVSGSSDSTVRLWDLRRKNCRSTFKGHSGGVTCVRFSPDGSQVVSGSEDGRIKIWDLNAGKLLQEFHHKGVSAIEYHPNDFLMCSVGKDKCIRMWDVDQMELVCNSTKQPFNASCVRFDRSGNNLLTVSEGMLKSWEWEPSFNTIDTLTSNSGLWSDNVQDMRITSTRQNQAVISSATDSFVSTWVINMENSDHSGEDEQKEQKVREVNGESSRQQSNNRSYNRSSGSSRSSIRHSPNDIDRRRGRDAISARNNKSDHGRKVSSPRSSPHTSSPPAPSSRSISSPRSPNSPNSPKRERRLTDEKRRTTPVQRTPPRIQRNNEEEGKIAAKPRTLTHSPVTSPAPSPINSPRRSSSTSNSTTPTNSSTNSTSTSAYQRKDILLPVHPSPPSSDTAMKITGGGVAFDAATSMGSSFFGMNKPGNGNKRTMSSRNYDKTPLALPGSKYDDAPQSSIATTNATDITDNTTTTTTTTTTDTSGFAPGTSTSLSSSSDLANIAMLRKSGKSFRKQMSGRLRELRVVQSLWVGSSRTGGKDSLSHVQSTFKDDPSIALDFILNTKLDGGAFDLLSCVTLLPLISNLLNTHQYRDEHILGLINAVQTLYRGFGEVICHNAKRSDGISGGRFSEPKSYNPFSRDQIDIGSEERVHRATACYESLTKIAKQISVLMQETKSTQVQRSAKELHRLFRKKDIM